MLEIASQMILCLLLASLLGFIIGYLFGKGTCASDECGQNIESHNTHDSGMAHTTTEDTVPSTTISTAGSKETLNANNEDKPMLLSSPRNGTKDNLTRIKGIGIKIEEALNNIGIYHFDQIAAWDADNIAWADSTLGFPGRAKREEWVAQAKALSAGEETEFSKRVDAGEVSSSKKS